MVKKSQRAKEILQLLVTHGPLTASAIARMLEPPMQKNKLYEVLVRLANKHFIDIRTEAILNIKIYQITQKKKNWDQISKLIKCNHEDIFQPYFRYRELLYNNASALLHHKLLPLLPKAYFVRDFKFNEDEFNKVLLESSPFDRELKPNLLIHLPKEEGLKEIRIAFEIEKIWKSNKRLVKKFKKYTSDTRLDGLIYFFETERLVEAIKYNFRAHALPRALRKKHSGEFFLMFAPLRQLPKNEFGNLYSYKGKAVSLASWLHSLRLKKT